MREKVAWPLWKGFLAFFTVLVFWMVKFCIKNNQQIYNASELLKKMALYAVIILAIGGISCVIARFARFDSSRILPVFLLVYGVAFWFLCTGSRGVPVTDSGAVYQGALHMAGLSDEISWTYFARWSNNTMPMIFMSLIIRAANFLGVKDVYYAVVFVNLLQVLVAMYCTYQVCYRVCDRQRYMAWMGMGLLGVYFPLLGHTQSTYTDAGSFCFGIAAFYCWLRNREKNQGKKRYWLGLVFSGLLWGIGAKIKFTVIISLIAVILFILLFDDLRQLRNLGVAVLTVAVIMVSCRIYVSGLPSREHRDTWEYPHFTYFIALGLERDGSFSLESEYFNYVGGIYGLEEKEAFTREFIRKHISAMWDITHMELKLLYNFASGTMNASDFFQVMEKEGFVWRCIAWDGDKNHDYRYSITAYWYLLLCLVALGCAVSVFRKKNRGAAGGEENACRTVAVLSIFGIMCYLMLGEANNRQLYNHLPWIACAASMGLYAPIRGISLLAGKVRTTIEKKGKNSGEEK